MSEYSEEAEKAMQTMEHSDVVDYALRLLAFVEEAIDLWESFEGDELFGEYHFEMGVLLEDGPA